MREAVKHPFVAGAMVGGTYGVVKEMASISMERANNYNRQKGMPANNLSTDGLTLSLSKLRHRN